MRASDNGAAVLTAATILANKADEGHTERVELIRERFDACNDGVHSRARTKWEHLWALYRNYQDFRDNSGFARDRDMGLRMAAREWGADLSVPIAFSTVESVLPRMLSNSPKVIVKPRGQKWEGNAPNMKAIIDSQFHRIDYELILQDVTRTALIYGLGIQKVYWACKTRESNRLAPSMHDSSKWIVEPVSAPLSDDPMVECVDPFDFFWDPFAGQIQDCEWVIHRTWRSMEYVSRRFKSGEWTGVTREDVENGAGGSGIYDETWSKREKVNGYAGSESKQIHEVWEYHDREKVTTVLDREWIVQDGPNPAWHGELPFQVFRPTPIAGRLVGIGDIEPIEDLANEMNEMRGNRLDNARVAIDRSFFYMEGMIDPADFKLGPGLGIPVQGDPREIMMPVPIADIPNSGYQEENALRADIERTTGLDDTAMGGSSSTTATGTQLTQAMANLRIQQKTRRAEVELVRGAGRQVLALNQQKILTSREVATPAPPEPGNPDRRWAWKQVGPAELAGEFELEIEGGSMAPENVPQQRSDAQMMAGMMQTNPEIIRSEGLKFQLVNMGINTPESFISPEPPKPTVDPQALGQVLEAAGVDPNLIGQAIASVSKPPEETPNG